MGLSIFSQLQNLWPFSALKFDDLKASNQLVGKLSLPENTKQFVFAVREPDSEAVVYILAVQNLSERSVADVQCLIKEVQPNAVVVQISNSSMAEFQSEEIQLNDSNGSFPTSSLGVLRRCFLDKVSSEKYEDLAGNLVLREIFGTSFHGHFFAAKRAAEDIDSTFSLLESPFMKSFGDEGCPCESEPDTVSKFQGFGLQLCSLVPLKAGAAVSLGLNNVVLTNDFRSQMVKALSPYLESSASNLSSSISIPQIESGDLHHFPDYEAPPFAQSVYPLLVDLYNIFTDLPSIGKALAHAQKILYDVSQGEIVDGSRLCEVYTFRLAIEGLRIALNNAARLPVNEMRKPNSAGMVFSELSVKEKSHALLAEALRCHTQKFKTVVAIVDASILADLRRYWNTPVPQDMKDLVGGLVTDCQADGEESSQGMCRKKLLTKKSVVAVGAGATAVVGVSSLSKAIPASTIVKVVTFKLPTSFKLPGMALSKALGSSKIMAPGMAGSGTKMHLALKSAAASAKKIRVVTHGVIASAEKTSFSAMRTAFYEIMRKRCVRPVGQLPWATFGCSLAACAGLFAYGDGIECAAESLPMAPSIASLGRGIQGLLRASEVVKQSHAPKVHKSVESLMHRFRRGESLLQ